MLKGIFFQHGLERPPTPYEQLEKYKIGIAVYIPNWFDKIIFWNTMNNFYLPAVLKEVYLDQLYNGSGGARVAFNNP